MTQKGRPPDGVEWPRRWCLLPPVQPDGCGAARHWVGGPHRQKFGAWQTAKELASLIQKGVYEVRKIPHGVKAMPTKLVLRIKLKSDVTVEKYKVQSASFSAQACTTTPTNVTLP